MKRKKFAILVIVAVALFLLCSCLPEKKEADGAETANLPPNVETVSESEAIDLSGYTIIRSDSSSKSVTGAALELRKAIQERCGYQLDLKTDFSGGSKLEIVIGKTKRGGTDGLNRAEYVIKHGEKGFLIAGGSDEATVAAVEFFIENLISSSGALCKSDFEYTADNSLIFGDKTYDRATVYVEFGGEECLSAIESAIETLGIPHEICDDIAEANIVLTTDPEKKISSVPAGNWGAAVQDGVLYLVGRNEYDREDVCSWTVEYFSSIKGKFVLEEKVLKLDKNISKEEFYNQKNLTVYPEFPESVRRDYMYRVSVTQGDRTEALPVYNHCQPNPHIERDCIGGDNWRRFSIFAFSGEQVRVDVKVGRDFSNYCVLPSAKEFKSEFKNGVISVYLDRPEYFMIRLDDDNNTILSILADYPEFPLDIPSKDDPKVTWISGVSTPKDGFTILSEDDSTLYIEPGAVLFSRVKAEGDNCKILGRGAVIDPFGNYFDFNPAGQTESKGIKLIQLAGNYGLFDGPVILDGHCYNFNVGKNCTVRNGKALSVMITSDGLQLGSDSLAERCFVYVGDNGTVFGGQNTVFRDVTIGTTCAAIFPQGGTSNIKMENIYVFRSDGGLINNRYNGSSETPPEREHSVDITGLYADDCTCLPWFFQGQNMGRLDKVFNITNATSCGTRGTESHYSDHTGTFIRFDTTQGKLFTDNYTLNIKNLYIGGSLVKSGDDLNVRLSSPEKSPKNEINVEYDDTRVVTRKNIEVGYRNSLNVFIGALQVYLEDPVIVEGGKTYLPFDEIRSSLRTTGKANTEKKNGIEYVEVNNLVAAGLAKKAEKTGNALVLTPAYDGGNVLPADSAEHPHYIEAVAYKVDMTASDTDGEIVYSLFNVAAKNAGITGDLTDEVRMYGNGIYVLEFEINGNGNATVRTHHDTAEEIVSKYLSIEMDGGWQKIKFEMNVNFNLYDLKAFTFRIVAADEMVKSFDVKNITVEKIS